MHSLPDDALDRFRQWLSDAERDELNDPTAMSLATVSAEGRPSVRMVLLKGVDAQGFVFYTNLESRKGLDLAANRHAALCFHWKSLRRQVRVEGAVTQVSDADADQYFASRPRQSQIGAWASHQSRAMSGRVELEQAVAVQTARFGVGPIPRPTHWSGFCLAADRIEFWQDKPFRLHDRQVYTRVESVWMTETLYP